MTRHLGAAVTSVYSKVFPHHITFQYKSSEVRKNSNKASVKKKNKNPTYFYKSMQTIYIRSLKEIHGVTQTVA